MLRALVRFWWVALLGIVLAGLAFTYATYHVKLGLPPKLTARTQPTYSASTQMLVTSKRDPNLSASNVNAKVIPLGKGTNATVGTATTNGTAATGPTYTYDSSGGADGDLQRMDEIANNLPPRVTSDPVVKLRNKLFGRIDGSVTAANPYAFSGAGGFRSGPLPYIQINGTADSAQDAVSITNQTAVAFIAWFKTKQVANDIPANSRVVVEQVNSADHAIAGGGSKPLLGVAAALLVLLGASGFAMALDRLIPRRRRSAVRVAAPAAPERSLPASERALPTGERALPGSERALPATERGVPATEPSVPAVERKAPVTEPALPALEVPTMTLGARVEDAITGEAAKRTPRPRKPAGSNGTSNDSGKGSGSGSGKSNGSAPAPAPVSGSGSGKSNGSASASGSGSGKSNGSSSDAGNGSGSSNGSATKRRRATSSTPRVAPTSDDAS
jgi:hypothetical protein